MFDSAERNSVRVLGCEYALSASNPKSHFDKPALGAGHGVPIEQRHQRIVAGLTGGQPDRHRGLALIGEGMDLGGQPAAGATDRMVSTASADFL